MVSCVSTQATENNMQRLCGACYVNIDSTDRPRTDSLNKATTCKQLSDEGVYITHVRTSRCTTNPIPPETSQYTLEQATGPHFSCHLFLRLLTVLSRIMCTNYNILNEYTQCSHRTHREVRRVSSLDTTSTYDWIS